MMYRKIHALFLCFAMMLATVAGVCAKPSRAAASPAAPSPAAMSPAVAGAHLLSVLPASDFVVYVDTQRLLTDAVPAFLATRPDMLTKMNAGLDKVKIETGIDLRSFDMLAVGMRYGSNSLPKFKMVSLARGRFDASAVINGGFAASAKEKKAFQLQGQEDYKGKTVYVIGPPGSKRTTATLTVSPEGLPPAAKSNVIANPVLAEEEVAQPQSTAAEKMAVTALDSSTIAAGDLESIRATIDAEAGGARVDDELVQLATRNTSALVGFSGKQPSFLIANPGAKPDSQDSFLKALESIRQYYGSFSTVGTDTETNLNLRTDTPERAREIKEMISVFKFAEGVSAKPTSPGMPPNFLNFLKALTINVEGNEVQLQLKLTQSDITPFIPRM